LKGVQAPGSSVVHSSGNCANPVALLCFGPRAQQATCSVLAAGDWKRNEHMPEEAFCDEFHLADLRVYDECTKLVQGCEHVFNLAADMGGMGFIQSNHSVIL
jgi:hypothetical protein